MPVFHTPQVGRRSSGGRASLGLSKEEQKSFRDENLAPVTQKPPSTRALSVRRSGPFGGAPVQIEVAGSNYDVFRGDCIRKLKLPARVPFKLYNESGELIKDVFALRDGTPVVVVMTGETFKRASPDSKTSKPSVKTPTASCIPCMPKPPVDDTFPLDDELEGSPGEHEENPIKLDLSIPSALSPVEGPTEPNSPGVSPLAVFGGIHSPGREQPQRLSFGEGALHDSPARVFSPIAPSSVVVAAAARPDDSLAEYQNITFTLTEKGDEKHLSPDGVRRHQRISIAAALLAGPRGSLAAANSPSTVSTTSEPGPAHSPMVSPREVPPSRLRPPQIFSPRLAEEAPPPAGEGEGEEEEEVSLSESLAAEPPLSPPSGSVDTDSSLVPSLVRREVSAALRESREREEQLKRAADEVTAQAARLQADLEAQAQATEKLREEKAALERAIAQKAAQAEAVAMLAAQAEASTALAVEKAELERRAARLAEEKAALEHAQAAAKAAAAKGGAAPRRLGVLATLGRVAAGAAAVVLAVACFVPDAYPAALS